MPHHRPPTADPAVAVVLEQVVSAEEAAPATLGEARRAVDRAHREMVQAHALACFRSGHAAEMLLRGHVSWAVRAALVTVDSLSTGRQHAEARVLLAELARLWAGHRWLLDRLPVFTPHPMLEAMLVPERAEDSDRFRRRSRRVIAGRERALDAALGHVGRAVA